MKKSTIIGWVFGFLVMGVVFNVLNHPRESDIPVSQTSRPPQEIIYKEEIPPEDSQQDLMALVSRPTSDVPLEGEVLRQSFVTRGDDHIQNVFYKDGKEIARQTVNPDGTIEQTGEIPDGRVKFIDAYNKSKGEEHYISGKKFGETKAFYSDGPVQSEEKYQNDKLIYSKNYYHSGILRSDINYEDARRPFDGREVGVGKLFYPDGRLKYEWNLTNSELIGFRKSYNTDGTLRAETYFDERGNEIPNPQGVTLPDLPQEPVPIPQVVGP